MKNYTMTELRKEISGLGDDLVKGESIMITRNKRVIGYLIPPPAMHAVHQLTVATIADELGVPVSTIIEHVSRLCADTNWGPGRTVLVARADSAESILSFAATIEIYGAVGLPAHLTLSFEAHHAG